MNIPDDLRYSENTNGYGQTAAGSRVGITDYAQDALGDIVYVDLPAVGTEVAVGRTLGEVESTKSVSEIYAPVAGTIAGVNDALPDAPERINADPYGEGWICELELAEPGGLDALLDAAAYRRPDRRLSAVHRPPAGKRTVRGVPWLPCSVTTAGIGIPRASTSARPAAMPLLPDGDDATITLHPADDSGEPGEEDPLTLVEIPTVRASWW